jgi:hypothetical protein
MPWRNRQLMRDTLEMAREPTVVGVVALTALLSQVWAALTSLVALAVLSLWALDMISGVLRSVDREGLDAFSWSLFVGGFRKGLMAGVTIAFAAVIEVLLVEIGVQWVPVLATGLGLLAFGFAWSVVQNIGHFYPEVADGMSKLLHRAHGSWRDEESRDREGDRTEWKQ